MEKYVNLNDVENRIIALSKIVGNPFDGITAFSAVLSGLIQSINELPTKELDDFTEGTWEWEGQNLYNPYMSRCSECGHLGDAVWSYCPRCGSKMKKNDKEIKYITQQGITETTNIMIHQRYQKYLEKPPEGLKNSVISDYKE